MVPAKRKHSLAVRIKCTKTYMKFPLNDIPHIGIPQIKKNQKRLRL